MKEGVQLGVEVRQELMLSPSDGIPTKKLAHFLKPTIKSSKCVVFELPSDCLDHLPPTFEPKKVAFESGLSWMERNDIPKLKVSVFSWGEATITLEDLLIVEYSVLKFLHLRPEPNLIKTIELRFACWHEQFIVVENVRKAIDSAKGDFNWRPYAVTNWNSPKFYREKEMLISIDPNLSEELHSFAHCLRVSELVGFEYIEQYLPHHVAMQFEMDQDLPPRVARINKTPSIAWNYYSASECSFIGTKKTMEMAKGKREADASSRFKTKPKILGGTNAKSFIKRFKKTLRFDGMNKVDGVSTHSSSMLKSLREVNDSLVPPGFPPKSIVAETKDSAKECDMTIADFMKSIIKHDDGNKNMMQDEPKIVEVVPKALSELATDSKASDQDHDMVRM
ncbi:hypothetical protein Pint_04184 [Pistacia integerrima]|uniref:Uncharacterized protein n=1 Tax=Pistacia integerrima TaxID=434235 RepID=A0ACC0Z4D8_9ROSI|nr:hypothetical protein Pint_04184 [Pistacia integerrima]